MNERPRFFLRRLVTVIAFFFLWVGATISFAGQELVEILAIRENAQRLVSGECRATGQYTLQSNGERDSNGSKFDSVKERLEKRKAADTVTGERPMGEPQIYEETLEWAFDFASDRTSFERTRRHVSGGHPTFSYRKSGVVLSPEKMILVRGNRPDRAEVTVMAPDDEEEITLFFEPVFNLKSLGLEGLQGAATAGLRPDYPFLYGRDEHAKVTNDDQVGIRRINSFVHPLGEDTAAELHTWWCDENQGLQPVRYEMKRGFPNPSSKREEVRNKLSKTLEEAECTWQEINGVWVLSTLKMTERSGAMTKQLELNFSWKAVNNAIPDSRFDWKSWDLQEHSKVVDVRMGSDRPVLVTEIGDSPVAAIGATLEAPASSGSSILLYVNLVVIGLVAGWALHKARLKQKND